MPFNGKTYELKSALSDLKRIDWVQNKNTKNRTNCFMIFLTFIFFLPTKIVSLQTKIIIL